MGVGFRKFHKFGILLGGLIALGWSMSASAIESPDFTVVRETKVFQIRHYSAYCVAEVVMNASATDAGSKAFPILAGYIFGKNKAKQTMEMTAPVIQKPESIKMDMTAPVMQVAGEGGYVVQFVMPKKYTLQTLPEPDDSRVKLREIPSKKVAVIKYSGTWSQKNYDNHLQLLQSALQQEGIATRGEPIYSRYNPPFTPWFMRTNEIWLEIQ
jgi:hypothetical protein